MAGTDVLFGEGQDDAIVGGYGNDWISGGNGHDGVLGDDSRIYTYRVSSAYSGPLYGFAPFAASDLNLFTYSPGKIQQATITVPGELIKAVNLTPYSLEPTPREAGDNMTHRPSNSDDIICGGLGNDWIVGGTGKGLAFGRWADDLINMDDDQTTAGGRKNQPDTATSYGGVAHGGAGRDVLIGNTGGDRLVDWVGEFSSYLVPFLPSGADRTRAADAGIDPLRNGEPNGELGMVMQSGFAWREQTGVPADPQPGNANGTARDVLRAARLQRRHGLGLRHRPRPVYDVRRGLPGVADQARRRRGDYVRRRRMATHLFRAEGERRRRQADGRLQVQRQPDPRVPIADRLQVRRRWRIA